MLSSPRRLLLILHELSLTGAPKIAFEALRALPDLEIRTIALDDGPFADNFRTLGTLQIFSDLPDWKGAVSRRRRQIAQRMWSRDLRRWQPDLIYVNSVAALPVARFIALPPGVPVLLHVHELDTYLARAARQHPDLLLNWPAQYIAVSEAVRTALVRHGVDKAKVEVIHEFVADETLGCLSASTAAAQQPMGEVRPFLVGGGGKIQWRKGSTLWLQMARELADRVGEARVRFVWVGVGEGEPDQQFREEARQLNVAHLIEFVPITRDPLAHFARCDAFAMTSWEDPCPIVVLEAMTLEKPVVCFAGGGGAAEEVGETGLVIAEFSPAKMAEALAALRNRPEQMRALGRAARERVRTHFTASVQVPKIQREINRLTANHSGGALGESGLREKG